jgi:hypothetical protein
MLYSYQKDSRALPRNILNPRCYFLDPRLQCSVSHYHPLLSSLSLMLMSPAELRLRKAALAMPSNNWKLQARPLFREGAPHQQTRNYLKIIKDRRKIGHGPQVGAWHQDRLRLWLVLNGPTQFILQYKPSLSSQTAGISDTSIQRRIPWSDKSLNSSGDCWEVA